jgi:hypothetical protein
MPEKPSLADYGKELEAAIEWRKQLENELQTANSERRHYLRSCLHAVEQSIRNFEAAVRDHQPHPQSTHI